MRNYSIINLIIFVIICGFGYEIKAEETINTLFPKSSLKHNEQLYEILGMITINNYVKHEGSSDMTGYIDSFLANESKEIEYFLNYVNNYLKQVGIEDSLIARDTITVKRIPENIISIHSSNGAFYHLLEKLKQSGSYKLLLNGDIEDKDKLSKTYIDKYIISKDKWKVQLFEYHDLRYDIAFLKGVYFRYGKNKHILLPNYDNQSNEVIRLLSRVGCKNIKESLIKDKYSKVQLNSFQSNILSIKKIEFTASCLFQKYIEQ